VLTPQAIVAELDKYIIGQAEAKRAIAVALRNRDRRRQLPDEVRREIMPKNILMIGPTGVGKTEIARRVAALIGAPFVKVEATRFTEVGYVGRDVDSIIRDLVEAAIDLVYKEKSIAVKKHAERQATERLVDYLCQQYPRGRLTSKTLRHPHLSSGGPSRERQGGQDHSKGLGARDRARLEIRRQQLAELLKQGKIEDAVVEIEAPAEFEGFDPYIEFAPGLSPEELQDQFAEFARRYQQYTRKRVRRVSVRDARRLLVDEETEKLVDYDEVVDAALARSEELGVVFIDEIDKLVGPEVQMGPDVSGEGVQRDLLPIVEGCTVQTRYGPVKTDHILFIAAGSFQRCRPSDLIPELQGRFPLRVELASLSEQDFVRILTEPQNALIRQYKALLSTEGVTLEVTDDGVAEIAHLAYVMNQQTENIGARRLATIMEKVLEDVSFRAAEFRGQTVIVDRRFVQQRLAGIIANEDLSKYIL